MMIRKHVRIFISEIKYDKGEAERESRIGLLSSYDSGTPNLLGR